MTNPSPQPSLATFALIAGISLVVMVVAAPFAELFIYPKLVIANNPLQTAQQIRANQALFVAAIGAYLLTFMGDLLVTWALYFFLKPVDEYLSLLAAWFRLIFTVIALVALLNLLTVFRLLTTTEYVGVLTSNQLYTQATLCLNTFRSGFHFGLLFFAIHLVLVGYLLMKASYTPSWLGVLLIITGLGYLLTSVRPSTVSSVSTTVMALGYLLTSVRPYVFPQTNFDFVQYTYYGEVIFIGWLLVKGSRVKEANHSNRLTDDIHSR